MRNIIGSIVIIKQAVHFMRRKGIKRSDLAQVYGRRSGIINASSLRVWTLIWTCRDGITPITRQQDRLHHKLVQFQARTDHAVDTAHYHHQAGLNVTVQRYLVHTVE